MSNDLLLGVETSSVNHLIPEPYTWLSCFAYLTSLSFIIHQQTSNAAHLNLSTLQVTKSYRCKKLEYASRVLYGFIHTVRKGASIYFRALHYIEVESLQAGKSTSMFNYKFFLRL